jgi:hypothetical protein
MVFDGCVLAGTAYMKRDQTKEISCALKPDTLLVALPAERPTENELVSRAVLRMAAEMLSESEAPGSRWCFLPPQQRPDQSHSMCVQSEVPIERLFVVRGRQLRVTVKRVGDGVFVTNVSATAGEP